MEQLLRLTFVLLGRYNQGCGRIAILTLKRLVDSAVLPFNLTQFPLAMADALDAFNTSGIKSDIMEFYPDYSERTLQYCIKEITVKLTNS